MMAELGNYVSFIPGVNPSRLDTTVDFQIYDQSDFLHDYYLCDNNSCTYHDDGTHYILHEGDVIISSSMQKAVIVSKENNGKLMTLNFIKVLFKDSSLDKAYFTYLYNNHSMIKKQKEKEMQGTGLVVRIPIKSLSRLLIPIVPLEKQRQIGQLYRKMLRLQDELDQYRLLLEKGVNLFLEDVLKEEVL